MSLPISYNDINKNMDFVAQEEEKQIITETRKNKDILFNFEKGEFVFEGIEPFHIYTRTEIIKQWIKKLFHTERDKWNVYTTAFGYPYGLNIKKYVGQQLYPRTDIIELIKDDIYNSLMNHKEIKEVHALQLVQIDDELSCAFIVELTDGEGFETEERVQ